MRGRDGTRASRIGAPGFAGWRAALIATLLLLAAPLARAGGIVLYTSPTTQAYLVKVGGSYDAVAGPWRRMLAARRIVQVPGVEVRAGNAFLVFDGGTG
ncbi:MAG TPA: hypothetical protein PLL72_17475, partial [Burkholderiaceae bacterium]|nr:hypothetical protein [Burkholderiaceae bacterium]